MPAATATARTPIALTIAGSDSSGGAGIQADLKVFTALGVYGASVITALTAQNTRGVIGVETVTPAFVVAQIDAVLSDLAVGAIKTGMLATAAIVEAVAHRLSQWSRPLVVDPVMVATSGDALLAPDAAAAVKRGLIPLATLITPNLSEAACLLDAGAAQTESDMVEQAKAIRALGCEAVLIKGGHGAGDTAVDILFDGTRVNRFARPRLDTPHTHGTGCTLSAAVTALLARHAPLAEAVEKAKSFVWEGLQSGRTLEIGQGRGPVDVLFAIRRNLPTA
ncbi:MAG: bifunctional hydroxymethylpyrimidine kinase/phosphomethylpyrimidine kinase [Hyphomicrobiaceae bacterium]|nr:MAG: bifunctional hydroxymethylpyrimidine kinase/phosphomethylpyrimidine kinase [Hyphomicrobiaceae bacterium]